MAWFIAQSAIMIALAFLVGLLVGWLIWGRFLRDANRALVSLRQRVRDCDRDHRPIDSTPDSAVIPIASVAIVTAADATSAVEEPVSKPVRIPSPRSESIVPAAVVPIDESDPTPIEEPITAPEPIEEPITAPEPIEEQTAAEPAEEPIADLARIEGIGPKIAAALVAAGIRGYRQLADADADALTRAINNAGITFAPSLVTWARQARLLADGDEDGFAELTARLIAGRDVDPITPVTAEEPAEEPVEDLQRIEGIGPKMSAALVAAGIRSYRQLAGSDETRLRDAIEAAGLNFAPSLVTWARQARLLADGDEEGFADLTRRLVAGRDEGRV